MTPLITVAGTPLPEPSKFSGITATIVDSGRNANGYMIGAVIRNDVGKISCSWNYLKAQDWANILSLFSPARGGSFSNQVTFYCQDTNSWITREMYVSDRKADIFKRNPDGSINGFIDVSLSLIEV